MPGISRYGAMTVVLTADLHQVLLLRREIFLFWDLPGGAIESGEEPADAAVRECREETGYEVSVDQFVGTYRHQSVYGRGDQLTYVFRAHASGGTPKRFGLETTGLRWFDPQHPPRGLQPLQHQMILDAIARRDSPAERFIRFPLWQLYPARLAFGVVRLVNGAIRTLFSHTASH